MILQTLRGMSQSIQMTLYVSASAVSKLLIDSNIAQTFVMSSLKYQYTCMIANLNKQPDWV